MSLAIKQQNCHCGKPATHVLNPVYNVDGCIEIGETNRYVCDNHESVAHLLNIEFMRRRTLTYYGAQSKNISTGEVIVYKATESLKKDLDLVKALDSCMACF